MFVQKKNILFFKMSFILSLIVRNSELKVLFEKKYFQIINKDTNWHHHENLK